MLLVNVQNHQTKESKVCIVLPDCVNDFLENHVPAGCVAIVQDCPVYLSSSFNLNDYLVQIAPDVYAETSDFKKKWYNSKNDLL